MARPLTGQREVMRRLQERNAGRRQRTNEVREMGGLEPIPEPEVNTAHTMRMVEEHIRNHLTGYVGRPNIEETHRAMLDSIMDGEPPRLIAGRSNTGRSMLGLSQLAAYQAITDHPVMYLDMEANLNRNVYSGFGVARELLERESAQPRRISTIAPAWSMSYLDTGLPVGRVDEMVTDFIGKDIECNLGSFTINDYLKEMKLNKVKQKENANNKDFKFILEKEY